MTDVAPETGTLEIPDKLYFKIGEVSELVGVKPYVLRYWETEFPVLSPKKSGTGHRLYQRKDVELLMRIRHLLRDQKFTIEGARQALEAGARAPRPRAPKVVRNTAQQELFAADPMEDIRRELADILDILK